MHAESEDRRIPKDLKEKRRLEETAAAASIKVYSWSHIHKRRQISRGGEAEIYEAELIPDGRIVAVRQKFFEDSDEEDQGKPFCAESRLMTRLHHPNIIAFHGVAAHPRAIEHNHFVSNRNILVDYMPNGNLEDVLKEDKDFILLPWQSRVLVAHQIAGAMEYIHSLGIIHFDLKPSNILLDLSDPTQPLSKISDFGSAREKQDDISRMHERGTFGYMAPEVVFCETITEKADVYPFGVIMYVLLTGDVEPKPSYRSFKRVKKLYLQDVGHHESVPNCCYHQWRELMKDCLVTEGSMRPNFSEVVSRLSDMLAAFPELQTLRPALHSTVDLNVPSDCGLELERIL